MRDGNDNLRFLNLKIFLICNSLSKEDTLLSPFDKSTIHELLRLTIASLLNCLILKYLQDLKFNLLPGLINSKPI